MQQNPFGVPPKSIASTTIKRIIKKQMDLGKLDFKFLVEQFFSCMNKGHREYSLIWGYHAVNALNKTKTISEVERRENIDALVHDFIVIFKTLI